MSNSATLRRRTPCVGICSTTYGDRVCRGCKRFAHEIDDWNRYAPEQQERVERRLAELRSGAVTRFLRLAPEHGLPSALASGPLAVLAFILEQTRSGAIVADSGWRAAWQRLGVELDPAATDPETLVELIDAEFLLRSQGNYERSFKVRA